MKKKRLYNSETRLAQSAQTKDRILMAAKKLFKTKGFEEVTITELAGIAGVSAPTVYSLFQSKRGILLELMKNAFPFEHFEALVEKGKQEYSAKKRLAICAKIARQINDAEKTLMDIFRGAIVIAPELKKLEKEKEQQRYQKLKETIQRMIDEKSLRDDLSFDKAHAILWAFTGRDMYRLFVIERGWSSDEYEKWLADTLHHILLTKKSNYTEKDSKVCPSQKKTG